jgi:hypothetical protein
MRASFIEGREVTMKAFSVLIISSVIFICAAAQATEPDKETDLFKRNTDAIDKKENSGDVGSGNQRGNIDPNAGKIINPNFSSKEKLDEAADGNAQAPKSKSAK